MLQKNSKTFITCHLSLKKKLVFKNALVITSFHLFSLETDILYSNEEKYKILQCEETRPSSTNKSTIDMSLFTPKSEILVLIDAKKVFLRRSELSKLSTLTCLPLLEK